MQRLEMSLSINRIVELNEQIKMSYLSWGALEQAIREEVEGRRTRS